MDINVEQKRTITRYLLGEMSEPQRSEFEDRYLDDPILFEELITAEDEIMRCYARDNLSEAERTAFERRFLANPHHRQRVDFAGSLMEYASSMHGPSGNQGPVGQGVVAIAPCSEMERQKQEPGRWIGRVLPGPKSAWQFAAVIALAMLIAGGSWLAEMDIRLRRAFEQMQAQHDTDLRREQELRNQLAAQSLRLQQKERQVARLSSSGPAIPSFLLASHMVRHSSPQKPLVIPHKLLSVVLQPMLCSNDYPSYSASLETAEGHVIWPQSDLKSWQIHNGLRVVSLLLPSKILKSGDYVLKVSGRTSAGKPEAVDSYAFRVMRR